MKDPTTFPLALSQANAQLLARIAELARTGGQQWYELVQRLVNAQVTVETSLRSGAIGARRVALSVMQGTPCLVVPREGTKAYYSVIL